MQILIVNDKYGPKYYEYTEQIVRDLITDRFEQGLYDEESLYFRQAKRFAGGEGTLQQMTSFLMSRAEYEYEDVDVVVPESAY